MSGLVEGKAIAAPFSLLFVCTFPDRPTTSEPAVPLLVLFACFKFSDDDSPAPPPVLALPPLTFYFADKRPRLTHNRSRSDMLRRLRLADSNSPLPSPCVSTLPALTRTVSTRTPSLFILIIKPCAFSVIRGCSLFYLKNDKLRTHLLGHQDPAPYRSLS